MALSPSDNLITHKKVSSEVSPVNCGDWNANHEIKNLMGYILIEERVLPAGTTSTTFSNLDGDTDEEYLIEFNVLISNPSFPYNLYLLPNGLSTNLRSVIGYFYSTPGTGNKAYTDKVPLAYDNTSANPLYVRGRCTVENLPNGYKSFIGESSIDSSAEVNRGIFSSLLSNTTNLTSITCTGTSGSFSGTIRLWKKIPVEV